MRAIVVERWMEPAELALREAPEPELRPETEPVATEPRRIEDRPQPGPDLDRTQQARKKAAQAGLLPFVDQLADLREQFEVTPDKRIVWEFPSPDLKLYRGNEDVNFPHDGLRLAVSEEANYDLHIVDYEKRQIVLTYGAPDVRGSAPGYLNYPDDAHILADGKMLTADIRNCRVLIIDSRKVSVPSGLATCLVRFCASMIGMV